jgi:hypothetical protein
MSKSTIVAGLLTLATAGSLTFLGGTAFACGGGCGGGGGEGAGGNSGGNGTGGTATNNCLNVGIPILSGIGVAGTGSASAASCNASANGAGGNAS